MSKITLELESEEYEKYVLWKNKKPVAKHFYRDHIMNDVLIEFIDESEAIVLLNKRIKELENAKG
jgi:hypothetical protein